MIVDESLSDILASLKQGLPGLNEAKSVFIVLIYAAVLLLADGLS